MSNWRRQKPRNNNTNFNHYHQRETMKTTTMQSSKPPLAANCKQSVPRWEKDFCAVVGSVPWRKVVETKRYMYLYDRVVQWDDSAGEDAFKNAKSRFWAEINGFPCDLSLPDPNVYIDDVDWDTEVDTELILDLERGPEPITEDEEEHVVLLDGLGLSQEYSGFGWGPEWGDAEGINEENDGMVKPVESSWDDHKCDGWNEKTGSWEHKKNENGFKSETWDRKDSNNKGYNQKKVQNWNGRDQGRESREWRKKEVPRGGRRVEDCRWRNGGRGGFQQHSNGWGWTESF